MYRSMLNSADGMAMGQKCVPKMESQKLKPAPWWLYFDPYPYSEAALADLAKKHDVQGASGREETRARQG